ncbi:MAG: DAK2 domain-containing protein [Lachnospiraceae bacterium]|nr:DAK2 domain-containing protein [Lachnospiraceae bacterium]MBP5599752.1 DAK2 domain-containing protein [Lachnospiraceae bacterium]
MATNTINAELLAKMFLAGANNLESKKEWINELNVFPVPDGDTGTNMTMTIMSAAKEVLALQSTNDITMPALCKAISSGSLKGARGNSGVILSQLLRGFSSIVKTKEVIDIPVIAEAFTKAVETAYKAVMKPKEGTILTVAKGACEKANELANSGASDMEAYIKEIIEHAEYVLSQTPEMLPVLKQAGVVDSGGQGLVEVMHGAFDAFLGKEIDFSALNKQPGDKKDEVSEEASSIKYDYDTEFNIILDKTFNIKHELDFKTFLETIGDSIALVVDENVVKVHFNTNDPGLAIQRGIKFGALSDIKIDNMRLEREGIKANALKKEEPAKDYGFISVSAGEGLSEIFKGLGVDYVIEGGQTMNPSTEDFVDAIGKINAKTIFILPNNKNIIMAANQAQFLVEGKEVIVIPTKTIPQGITAMINFAPDLSSKENEETMVEEIKNVKTGQVTYAVRDTQIDDKEIKEGDFMGIGDSGLLSVSSDMNTAVFEMIDEMAKDSDVELFSIYYGREVTEDQVKKIEEYINEKYSKCDVEINSGGQPIYYYIISAE